MIRYLTYILYCFVLQPFQLYSSIRRDDTEKIEINIRPVAELESADVQCIQIYNVIMRKCFELLKLEPIGRHYYDNDKNHAHVFPHHRLELWPGFATSIRNNESSLMMNVEIMHRVLRLDTALHVIQLHSKYGQPNKVRLIVYNKVYFVYK